MYVEYVYRRYLFIKLYLIQLEGNRRNLLLRQPDEQHNLTRERKLLWFADKMLQLGQTTESDQQLEQELYKLQNDMRKETF